jgi:hypothetical protein
LLRWLAWAHPVAMSVGLLLAIFALRLGLRLRHGRLTRQPSAVALRRLHLRVAKPAVVLLLVGFVGGPLSAVWLRGWEAFGTFHSALGGLAAVFLLVTGLEGRQLERGAGDRDRHALLAVLAVLFGGVAAFAGFVLLP